MKAEIIAVGTELLLGEIANSNAQEISVALASVGVDVLFHTVVGDNEQRIASTLSDALNRCDVVIITGGLGPTHDDLTREAISRVSGRKLEERAELVSWLRERFERMGRHMAESNLRQAQQPQGAEAIPNPRGTAPGVFLEHEGTLIYAVPGVPVEMRGMLEERILPDLRRRTGGTVLVSHVLRVVGMGESDVATHIREAIDDLDRNPGGATIALLSSPGEVRVRISAKASNRDDALDLISPVTKQVRDILGPAVFGTDDELLEGVVSKLLREKGMTLAIAESVTGGLVSSRIVDIPGASEFLLGSFVAYSNKVKLDLGVPLETLERHGDVSAETALAMASGVRAKAGAAVGISTTGEAGPDPKSSPIGTVFVALSSGDSELVRNFVAPGGRTAIRMWASQAALNLLRLWLIGEAR